MLEEDAPFLGSLRVPIAHYAATSQADLVAPYPWPLPLPLPYPSPDPNPNPNPNPTPNPNPDPDPNPNQVNSNLRCLPMLNGLMRLLQAIGVGVG